MQAIIPPLSKSLLKTELNKETFVRKTNKGNNEIYIVNQHNAPNVLLEIGRLRELTFRDAGGGTGKEIDIDEYDTAKVPYEQLIVWDPSEEEIVGGYRYFNCRDVQKSTTGDILLATTELFNFSDKFITDYLPYTIELGRSFVQTKFQPSGENRKGLFSLDNLWDGLGALIVDNPEVKYFYGKVTMYPDYNAEARDMILYFMEYYFPDKEKLVLPIHPLVITTDLKKLEPLFKGLGYKEGHMVLNQHVRSLGENIPPLVNSYMNTSPNMKSFGTAINDHFGAVEETGILVTIKDIYPTKKERHVNTYSK